MGWLDKFRPHSDTQVLLKGADKVFTELSAGDNVAAKIYREHPAQKKSDWKAITRELKSLRKPDGTFATKDLLAALAVASEALEEAGYYMNLSDDDRTLIARHIFNSTREVQDRAHYLNFPCRYMWASILEFTLVGSNDGNERFKKDLNRVQKTFSEACVQHNALLLKIAKAKAEGRELTAKEKEDGQFVRMLKEGARRALAGEKVLDD
jgi:hypothetical protein